jgi:hypothetical protein
MNASAISSGLGDFGMQYAFIARNVMREHVVPDRRVYVAVRFMVGTEELSTMDLILWFVRRDEAVGCRSVRFEGDGSFGDQRECLCRI